ncbi:MAG: hypothetical protein HC859_12380 [Bacteroidia bacterium]|nr:hypothetical protein [Bacteroidia bacterium]
MKKLIWIAALALAGFVSCDDGGDANLCNMSATMRDLSGLDGCNFAFELSDGTYVIPALVFYCGTPPLPENETHNPFNDVPFEDGKVVLISFTYSDIPNVCMAGPLVTLTCVREVGASSAEE